MDAHSQKREDDGQRAVLVAETAIHLRAGEGGGAAKCTCAKVLFFLFFFTYNTMLTACHV